MGLCRQLQSGEVQKVSQEEFLLRAYNSLQAANKFPVPRKKFTVPSGREFERNADNYGFFDAAFRKKP
jgi:hypothetical protein